MKKIALMFVPGLLLTVACMAQSASVSVSANRGLPVDPRPFGKYLVEICTLSGADRALPNAEQTLTCTSTERGHLPAQNPIRVQLEVQQTDQAITLKLVCDPNQKTPCNSPLSPVAAGTDFFVSAATDSGRPVNQDIFSGEARKIGGSDPVRYHANRSGRIMIKAFQSAEPAGSRLRAAAPVYLILSVIDDPKADKPCSVLPVTQNIAKPLDAGMIVSLLGNPTPFILTAQDANTIAVYSTRHPLHNEESGILASLLDGIVAVAGRTASPPAKSFTVELAIPHAAALGDLATRVNGLNYSQFTVQDVGSDQVRVNSASQPDCDMWKSFLSDIRRMVWQLVSEPMNKKLFYLSSSDVTTGFSALTPAASSPASTPVASASGTSTGSSASSAVGSNATISVTQPPGSNVQVISDTTPCVVAGLAFGNTNACGAQGPATAAGSSSSSLGGGAAANSPPKSSISMASVAVAMGTGQQSPADLLVFSDTNPGDDAQIQERLRIIAELDLPRPEMIINAWVTQNSSSDPQAMGEFTNMVKRIVSDYNLQFENVVLRGWKSLREQSQPGTNYFNEAFRSYVEDRFVADTFQENTGSNAQEMSQAFLDSSPARLVPPLENEDQVRGPRICPPNRYCLGYNSLFHPLKPALTDLLLTVIAARDPRNAVDTAINTIEGSNGTLACDHDVPQESRERCRAIWRNLEIDYVSPPPNVSACVASDYQGILYSLFQKHDARVHLQCFKEEADRLFATSEGAGLLRAAVADFLYNYKLSQQYPHEFTAYDLTRSADALNAALNPLIDAFNRDITTYQLFVRADMEYQVEGLNSRRGQRCCVKRLFGLDKPSFFNDGLITVRTISGQSTDVNTTSQSFLNVSTAPELASLLSSLAGTGSSGSGGGGSQNTGNGGSAKGGGDGSGGGGTGGNPAATAFFSSAAVARLTALAGLAGNFQTTFAQIGRGLHIVATPRSLSTASAAEIAVTLNADESASPSLYSTGTTTNPWFNTSRVANHDTTTRVRVDSVKLFEISSLTAILQRSRSRFPLLPPFVEIPYIGTLAGIPLGAAKEFHSSTAILSAFVVPTAADIAYGLRFVPDLVVDALNPDRCSFYRGAAGPDVTQVCLFRKALSFRDFGHRNLNNFNGMMIRCLANGLSAAQCQSITFDDVASMYPATGTAR